MERNSETDEIVIITKKDCSYCDNAKAAMLNTGIEFSENVIGQDITRDEALRLAEKAGVQNTLPLFKLNGKVVGNYNELLDYIYPPMMVSDKGTNSGNS